MGELFPERLETERLRLEALGPESIDVFALYEAFADDPDPDDVYAHVPLSPPETPHDSWEFVDRAASSREEGDAVTYLIRRATARTAPAKSPERRRYSVSGTGRPPSSQSSCASRSGDEATPANVRAH